MSQPSASSYRERTRWKRGWISKKKWSQGTLGEEHLLEDNKYKNITEEKGG